MTDHTKVRRHFKRVDKKIHTMMRDLDFDEWLKPHLNSPDNYFRALCREILGQQLSGKAANSIISRFETLLPGGTYEPRAVLRLNDEWMREAGMSWAKVNYIKNIASAFANGDIDAQQLHKWDDETVIAHLTAIKGVGPWTAEMFLIFTLQREDVYSYGDLGLRRGVEKVYGMKKPTIKEIEAIVTPWSPYRSFGSIALWHALE